MAELKTRLQDSGFEQIKTYLQSGNVVLKGKSHPERVVKSLVQDHFGFTPEVCVLTVSEFETVMQNNPYKGYEGKFVHVYFCKDTPAVNHDKIQPMALPSERYAINGKVCYLHAPDGIGRSKLVANIEACLGVAATGRNLNTVNKLESMVKGVS
jgi:uncharacterized protein (DUF1697 family)